MKEIVLSFGSNIGAKEQNILKAYKLLEQRLGERISTSSFFETKAWGFISKEMFVNSCAVFLTDKSPLECLAIVGEIEKELGRQRSFTAGYEDRIIDIDILFYEDEIIDTLNLKIPHPLLHLRNFVLEPLKQIASDRFHPVIKKKIKDIFV